MYYTAINESIPSIVQAKIFSRETIAGHLRPDFRYRERIRTFPA